MKTLAALLLCLFSIAAVANFGAIAENDRPLDVLTLSSGKTLEGHLLRETPDEVVFLFQTRTETHPKNRVESLRSPIPLLGEFVRRVEAVRAADVDGNLELAAWCEQQGLTHEARLLRWRAIAADWSDPRAHVALAHRERRGEWEVQLGRKWYGKERFEKATADWRDAVEVETSLVKVRGNLPLARVVEAALGWTRYYHAFFTAWGNDVGLPHASRWMEMHLHGDEKSFPKAGVGAASYFLGEEARVVVDTTRTRTLGSPRDRLGQILSATYANAQNARGTAPPWLAESLALFLAAALPESGLADVARILISEMNWFAAHAEAENPDSLNRILVASGAELREVPGHELRMAQAYTLFDFCYNARGGALREKLFEFARGTMAGRISPTDFQNALGITSGEFEAEWLAWARKRMDERELRLAAEESADGGDGV